MPQDRLSPIFSILLLLGLFANPLISIECSLCLASGIQPSPAACFLSATPRKSSRFPGARPAPPAPAPAPPAYARAARTPARRRRQQASCPPATRSRPHAYSGTRFGPLIPSTLFAIRGVVGPWFPARTRSIPCRRRTRGSAACRRLRIRRPSSKVRPADRRRAKRHEARR